ncbi:MAG: GNAT family N-acetyltransferase [Balneolaceae bacterium]|nr:GNAT family N-acetyltransferase [Balneolaceae bacterium]
MHNESEILFTKDEVLEQNTQKKALFTTRIFRQPGALNQLYWDWNELAEKSGQLMYMSPDWAGSWWKHFGQNKKRSLFIITAHDNGKLVAIFPFFKGVTTIAGKIIEQRLQLIGSGGNRNEQWGFSDNYGISDFLDFIVDPDYSEQIAELFTSLLSNSELSGYRIILNEAREDSYIKKFIYPILVKQKWPIDTEKTDICPFIDLTQADNLLTFVDQCKSNARRRFRQIFRAEGPEKEYLFQEARTVAEVEVMTDSLMELHQKRWNDVGFPGAFHDKRFRNFFKEIVLSAHKKNQLWLKQANDSKGVCAVRALLLHNGRYYDFMSGYDDDSPSAKFRPGIALLLNLINESFSKNVTTIELLRGEEGYKYDFTQKEITNWKITIPAQPKNRSDIILSMMIHFYSILYKYYQREVTLLKVQQNKEGFFKMIWGYLNFRIKSIRN